MKRYNLEDIQKYVAPKRQKRSTNGLSVMKVSKHAIYLSSNFVRATGLNLYKYVVMFAMSDNQIIIIGYMNIDEVPYQLRTDVVELSRFKGARENDESRQVGLKSIQDAYNGYKFMQFEPVEVSGRNGVLCTGIKQVGDAKDS